MPLASDHLWGLKNKDHHHRDHLDLDNDDLDDYDLNEDEMESNLLAMSNSLQILDNEADVDPDDDDDDNGERDCFGSTGLFTAM